MENSRSEYEIQEAQKMIDTIIELERAVVAGREATGQRNRIIHQVLSRKLADVREVHQAINKVHRECGLEPNTREAVLMIRNRFATKES